MGRPLKKKHFHDPANPGKQFMFTSAWIPGTDGPVTTAYIVQQKGTGKFIATDGTNTGLVALVDEEPTKAGEATIQVTPFGGGTEWARQINAHQVKCFGVKVFRWSATNGAVKAGDADLPMS